MFFSSLSDIYAAADRRRHAARSSRPERRLQLRQPRHTRSSAAAVVWYPWTVA